MDTPITPLIQSTKAPQDAENPLTQDVKDPPSKDDKNPPAQDIQDLLV